MRWVLVVLLAGCASQPEMVWHKDNSSRQEFEADWAQCEAQAFSVPNAMQNLLQVAAVRGACMRGKGWYLRPR